MFILFDVFRTLFSLDRVKSCFVQQGIRRELVELWLTRLFQSSMASTLAGKYTPFKSIARSVLKQLLIRERIPNGNLDKLVMSLEEIEPVDEAAECLRALRSDGHRLIALTDDCQITTQRLLERAGLWKWFERLYSADTTRACRPHHALYEHLFRTLFAGPYECCIVSAQECDILGAESLGMNSVYVAGPHVHWPFSDAPSGLIVSRLGEVPRVISDSFGKATEVDPAGGNAKWFGKA